MCLFLIPCNKSFIFGRPKEQFTFFFPLPLPENMSVLGSYSVIVSDIFVPFVLLFQAAMNTLRASGTLIRLKARFGPPPSSAATWFTTTTTAARSRCTQWMRSFLKNTSNAKCEYLTSTLIGNMGGAFRSMCLTGRCGSDSFTTRGKKSQVFPQHHVTKCPEL